MGRRAPDNTRNTGALKYNQTENYRKNIGLSEARHSAATLKNKTIAEAKEVQHHKESESVSWYLAVSIAVILLFTCVYVGYILLEWSIEKR